MGQAVGGFSRGMHSQCAILELSDDVPWSPSDSKREGNEKVDPRLCIRHQRA